MPVRPPGSDSSQALTCKAGEHLFQEGERHGAIFVIETGQVELLRAAAAGAQRMALLGAGDVLGEDAAFERRAAGCSARAVTDCSIVKVPAEAFEDVLRVRPDVGTRVIASIGRRLFEARATCATAANEVQAIASVGATGVFDRSALPTVPVARFIHAQTGASFLLPLEGEVVVGRADPRAASQPQIELSALDTGRSLSRRHAIVSCAGGQYAVTEQPRVANGTFLNGRRLPAGEPAPLHDGDEVCFGLVRVVFRTT